MKLSRSGAGKLIGREGERLKAYKDTKGIWTVGVGDTDLDNDGVLDVTPTTVLTQEQVLANFAEDVKWAEDAVNKGVKVALTQNQFDALVSFVFNVGASAFAKSTLLKVLNLGNYDEAAKQFDRWHTPPEIIGRRDGERDQFLS